MNKPNSVKYEIEKAKLEMLFNTLKFSMLPSLLIAVIMTLMLIDYISNTILAMWLTALVTIGLTRIRERNVFFRHLENNKINISYWEKRFIVGLIFSASTWGLSGIILYSQESIIHQAIVGFVIVGISSSALGTLIPNLKAIFIFVITVLSPYIIFNIFSTDKNISLISIIMFIHIIFTILSGKRSNRTLNENLTYKYETHRRSELIRSSEKKYRRLYENVEDPMIIIKDYNFVMVNHAAVQLFGYKSIEHLMNTPAFDLSPKVQADGVLSKDKAAELTSNLKNKGYCRLEWTYKKFNGDKLPADVTVSLVPFEGGNAAYTIVRDISQIKKNEIELIKARRKSEEANIAKSDFLANMSHEIRTPMNGIIGSIDLMLQHQLNKGQYNRALTVKSSALSMLSILNSILDFSKIEAGKLELEIKDFNLTDLLNQFSASISTRVKAKNIQYIQDYDKSTDSWYTGDSGRLLQIIINLVDNAIKFTNEGTIKLNYKVIEKNNKYSALKFEISDTGIGLHPNQKDKLFQRFTQGDSTTTRKYGGTGLGLIICKELTHLLGGDIGISESNGSGVTFWFTVKLEAPHEIIHGTGEEEHIHKKLTQLKANILIVDDNNINLEVAKGMLDLIGLKSTTVNNGQEAIDLLSLKQFDLVLMDCQMPILDGYKTTETIRRKSSKVLNHQIPIIAMTASALKGEKERCLDCGMDDYLPKPINLKDIHKKLNYWLTNKENKNKKTLGNIKENVSENELLFNYSNILQQLGGNKIMVEKIALKFILETTNEIENLKQQISQNNMIEIKSIAHKIKGSASSIGCNRLSIVANQFGALNNVDDIKIIENLHSKLVNCCTMTVENIEKALKSNQQL